MSRLILLKCTMAVSHNELNLQPLGSQAQLISCHTTKHTPGHTVGTDSPVLLVHQCLGIQKPGPSMARWHRLSPFHSVTLYMAESPSPLRNSSRLSVPWMCTHTYMQAHAYWNLTRLHLISQQCLLLIQFYLLIRENTQFKKTPGLLMIQMKH